MDACPTGCSCWSAGAASASLCWPACHQDCWRKSLSAHYKCCRSFTVPTTVAVQHNIPQEKKVWSVPAERQAEKWKKKRKKRWEKMCGTDAPERERDRERSERVSESRTKYCPTSIWRKSRQFLEEKEMSAKSWDSWLLILKEYAWLKKVGVLFFSVSVCINYST